MTDVTELKTVREHLETTAILFEELSEALSRVETRLGDIETRLHQASPDDSSGLVSITSDTSDLRATVINLRQHLDTALSAEIGPLTASLRYLQHTGIPELLDKTKELNVGLSSLHQNIPKLSQAVESLLASIGPLKANTELAGKFARTFHDPMQELLGRDDKGNLLEGKFILRNLAQVIFAITGRDEHGKPKEGELPQGRMVAFLTKYFDTYHMTPEGKEKSKGSVIAETFIDYFTLNFWHRIFDIIILVLLYLAFIAPVTSAIKSIQEATAQVQKVQGTQPAPADPASKK